MVETTNDNEMRNNMLTSQLEKDLQHTYEGLSHEEINKLKGSTILITGSAGFLGFYLVHCRQTLLGGRQEQGFHDRQSG
jgi:hypothetical protein